MKKAVNCLNLTGDGDDIDVLVAVERAFNVKITHTEAERCTTVGQLCELVSTKIGATEQRLLGCPTALAFFRLRGGLRRLGWATRVTRETDLAALLRAHGGRRAYQRLAREAKLKLPDLVLQPESVATIVLTAVSGVALSLWIGSWLPLIGCLILMVLLSYVLPTTIPRDIAELGKYAQNCAAWNYGKLSEDCGGARPGDLWNALVIVVRESSGTGFKGAFSRDTLFFSA